MLFSSKQTETIIFQLCEWTNDEAEDVHDEQTYVSKMAS